MKKRIIYFAILIFISTGMMAQNRGVRMTREEAINQKWNTIVEKLELTDSEKELAEPIFKEAELKIWELLQKNWEVSRKYRQKSQFDEESYEELNDNMINFELKTAALQKKYYHKLKEAGLSAKAIHELLKADRDFKRNLMRQGPGPDHQERNDQKKGQGQRGRR